MSVPAVPEDDELARQLAHLDALERRETEKRLETVEGGTPGIRPLPVQPRWPRGVPPPPPPGSAGASLAPYLGWLDFTCTVLEARVEANEGELERMRAQWVHVVSNLGRLRPEEIDAVVESQARLRESMANDAALHEVLRSQREQMAAWSQELAGPLTDPTLVRRLLDDVSSEGARATQRLTIGVVDMLSSLVLDLEVVQRTVAREPGSATGLLQTLRERVSGQAAHLRDQPAMQAGELVTAGEPLQHALRRIADRYSHRVAVSLRWSGSDVRDADLSTAVAAIAVECLDHLAETAGARCELSVDVTQGGVSLRIATPTPALLPDGEPSWLLRSRARAALGGGRLLCARAGEASGAEGSVVEVRFS